MADRWEMQSTIKVEFSKIQNWALDQPDVNTLRLKEFTYMELYFFKVIYYLLIHWASTT